MSRLLRKQIEETFDKESILQEIKQTLPNPWVWYTINDCMDEYGKPAYDLLIMRNKEISEEINFNGNPFSSVQSKFNNLYSVVLGVNVVDKFKSAKRFELTEEFSTASVEVKSWRMLQDIIREIDAKGGGIRHVD